MEDYLERLKDKRMQYYQNTYKDSIRWDGIQDIKDKIVIIYCEQGLGDSIQFSRYFQFIKCKKLIVHCDKTLYRLFKTLCDEVLDKEDNDIPEHDYHILSLSLPFLLKDPKVEYPFIKINSKKDLQEYNSYYKIGIAWEGNPSHSDNDKRSCPLKYFKHLISDKSKLFMIQKEIHLKELLDESNDLDLLGYNINDMYDTAELINSMDIIVSVDTSVLHLAGALNKKCFGLIKKEHDPRWNVRKWYDSVKFIRGDNWNHLLQVAAIGCKLK